MNHSPTRTRSAVLAVWLVTSSCSDSGRAPARGDEDATVAPAVPVIAVGPDAYRRWEALPVLKLGARTYMRSTYDRGGG
ncbi:MAG TPA: hypothetical protein VHU80_09840, partial [Polyangiaceae bacterium]|nr:hypothetical protein [Polyangiaceae bacterium]